MKKQRDPEARRLQKLRSALRSVWQYDPLRKAVITAACAEYSSALEEFTCNVCSRTWPKEMATVDHEPPLGSFTMKTIGDFAYRLFYGPQRAICKICHRKKTAAERRKK